MYGTEGSYPYIVTIVYHIIGLSGRDLVNRFSTLLVAVSLPRLVYHRICSTYQL